MVGVGGENLSWGFQLQGGVRVWDLGTLCRGHTLLHGAPFMSDLAGVCPMRFPLVRRHSQVAAGHVLIVGLFGGLGGLHTLGDLGAISLPGHSHGTRVEVVHQTHQCGLVVLELLRGGWEQGERGLSLGLTCKMDQAKGISVLVSTLEPLHSVCEEVVLVQGLCVGACMV